MSDAESLTVEASLDAESAERSIAKAVGARNTIARKHVLRIRRRRPDASPAEVIQVLERHYVTAITAAGVAVTVGTIAADVGIGMIPVAGAAAAGVKSAGTQAARAAAKQAAQGVALGLAKTGAQMAVTTVLPAGDEQLQFEITAIFALAIADIHDRQLDKDQAQALVYGLSNGRVSQQQIARMAADVAESDHPGAVDAGHRIADGEGGWATTLADSLPGGAAQTLVRTIQTGQLQTLHDELSDKQQRVVDYGAGALAGGVTRFVFGRDVVDAAHTAFPAAPDEFPTHLAVGDAPGPDDDDEPNRALAAMEEAAKATGTWITGTAGAVGGGIAHGAAAVGTAAETVTRRFRSVDLDGDGIPDEPQALTAAKQAGGAVAGAAGALGGGIAGFIRRKKRDEESMAADDAK